jgi:carbamoyl-phosphate synthase large subunit
MELNDSGVLSRYKVEMIGANADAIRRAEDRQLFKKAMLGIGLDLPVSESAHSILEAKTSPPE